MKLKIILYYPKGQNLIMWALKANNFPGCLQWNKDYRSTKFLALKMQKALYQPRNMSPLEAGKRFIPISPSSLGVIMASHYCYSLDAFPFVFEFLKPTNTYVNGSIIILFSVISCVYHQLLPDVALEAVVRPLVLPWVRCEIFVIFWTLQLISDVTLNKSHSLSPLRCINL